MPSLLRAALLAPAALLAAATLPETMRAGALTKRSWDRQIHLENFQEVQVSRPSAKIGEVLIQVAGASINPVEWKLMETPVAWAWSYPHISGFDVSGTVVEVGFGVTRLKVGDKVWALNILLGAHAEYVAVPALSVALAPTAIPLEHAGTMPLAALTDLEAFRFAKGPWHGQNYTVVVLGGSGGTGHMAVQLAKAWGATQVITTCGTSNVEFCKSLGADQVIDYHAQDWQSVLAPQSVDFIYDTVAKKGTGDVAFPILKDGGFYVSLLTDSLASSTTAQSRPKVTQKSFFLTQFLHSDLDALKEVIDQGKLVPHIGGTFSLAEIAQVFNTSIAGHTVGKLLVQPSKSPSVMI